MRPNPFPIPTPLQQVDLKRLVQLARRSFDRGWNFGTAGNFSLRGSGRLMWQSPSGVPKRDLTPGGFIPIDIDSLSMPGPALAKPSDETPLHAAVYRAFPSMHAVMHAHCPAAVRLSQTKKELAFAGQEMGKVFGKVGFADKVQIPVIDNTQDMVGLGANAARHFLKDVPVLVLRGHGVYAWGETPDRAMIHLEGLEFLCETQLV